MIEIYKTRNRIFSSTTGECGNSPHPLWRKEVVKNGLENALPRSKFQKFFACGAYRHRHSISINNLRKTAFIFQSISK